ncbi:MAG: prepilin-type N-terminal cleavage/methylation domain-containing protein [Rubrivivax sp.]|nr:prepilin-type N-terminal cleavage/methylation domain-containing protein [Rubrivivax sp.]
MKPALLTNNQRGVSLVEALVALAVMGIGMVGLVGVQSTLRSNSDVAKQRSEAVRLAQQEIEQWRAFVALAGPAGGTTYADLAEGTFTEAGILGSNASFTRRRSVAALGAPRSGKSVVVDVTWEDRSGETQRVSLATLIAGIAPELAATLSVPGDGDLLRQPQGRKRGIPVLAKDLGDGTSGFKPPGAAANVAWRFNDVSGLITLCTTSAASTADLTTGNIVCGGSTAMLLSGFLRYSTQANPAPSANDAANPPSPALSQPPLPSVDYIDSNGLSGNMSCVWQNTTIGATGYTSYFCAVPVVIVNPELPPSWSGTLRFADNPPTALAATLSENSAALYKVCRYHANAAYANIGGPQTNQNYLVIRAGNPATAETFTCPTSTFAHQPST